MTDITGLSGYAPIRKKTLIKLLSALAPRELGEQDGQYHIGVEAVKTKILAILGEDLGEDLRVHPANRLIKELRGSE